MRHVAIIMTYKFSAHQYLDCLQLKWTIRIREKSPYWSHPCILWLQMINAAARSQTRRTSSQMGDELSAADYKRETGGMRRWRRKKEKKSSGWLIPSGCLSDMMPAQSVICSRLKLPRYSQTWSFPEPASASVTSQHHPSERKHFNDFFNLVQRIKRRVCFHCRSACF